MNPGYKINPIIPGDLAGLCRFLADGFRLPADTGCMSPDVLRWKYLDPAAPGPAPLSLVARAGDAIVGHVGLCPRTFVVRGEGAREVMTTMPIDWLAATEHPSVGLML